MLGSKLVSPAAAISRIRPGERIYLSAGSAVPLGMLPALCDPSATLGDNEILHLLTLGEAPYTDPKLANRFRHSALFIGPNVREAVSEGRADYTPAFLSELPQLIRSGRIRIDVAIVSTTPPDAEGFCHFGTHIDLAPAATSSARLVIAQINPRMPRVPSPCRIHIDQLHAAVEIERELPELPRGKSRPETEQIARHILSLVPDGATLQLGIGDVPDAVLRGLTDRRDLGVHTEMLSDGVVDLVERGVINGQLKTLDPGKIVASFALGSRRLYDWCDNNPLVELREVEYTNDPFVIAQQKNMIAINSCLEIDLTGQVCSDSLGAKFYSGIGGQVDFIRGASRSVGGKPILAVPSTADGGTISRIVPRLSDGAGVVTTRGDVHYVITEYGIADLYGKTVRERAMALISVAHPRFRPWLLSEAKRLRFVRADQIEPTNWAAEYPAEFEKVVTLRDGRPVLLRPIRPTDEAALRSMFYRLSEQSIYQRFFRVKTILPHTEIQRFCTIDYGQDMGIVAIVKRNDTEEIVGWGSYDSDGVSKYADAAFLIADAWQGCGLGSQLMRMLAEIGRRRGLKGFIAPTLPYNLAMIRIFQKAPGVLESNSEPGGLVFLKLTFHENNG